jgi:hypothetical protein
LLETRKHENIIQRKNQLDADLLDELSCTAFTPMGFSFAAAQSLVEDHQINSLEEIRYLQDTEIEGLCNHYNMEDDPAIPNPGILVPVRAERNLKLAAYWLNHQVRVSRAVAEADLTLANRTPHTGGKLHALQQLPNHRCQELAKENGAY